MKRCFYFRIPSCQVIDYVESPSLEDAKAWAAVLYQPWANEIEWLSEPPIKLTNANA